MTGIRSLLVGFLYLSPRGIRSLFLGIRLLLCALIVAAVYLFDLFSLSTRIGKTSDAQTLCFLLRL
jgi:hypothetical protein